MCPLTGVCGHHVLVLCTAETPPPKNQPNTRLIAAPKPACAAPRLKTGSCIGQRQRMVPALPSREGLTCQEMEAHAREVISSVKGVCLV